jgi:hypothetical protein
MKQNTGYCWVGSIRFHPVEILGMMEILRTTFEWIELN